MFDNKCVCCGAIIPEGSQVCPVCLHTAIYGAAVEETPTKENVFVRAGKAAVKIAEDFQKSTEALVSMTGIKDSGDRTEFATGAVRDMREGKGRFDLMPLRVVAEYIRRGIGNSKTEERYWFFENIARFQETNSTEFLYCAMVSFELSAFEYATTMLLEVSKHFEEGAKKYGENNWQKGIPTWCYIDSAIRHYLKWLDGQTDERHDRAVMWNLMCCIWEVDYHKENEEEK